MLPPVLEVYVAWCPADDRAGQALAECLLAHFHGNGFAGLLGGAIEVFPRSSGWDDADGAPRPIPLPDAPAPGGVAAAELTAVVVLGGLGLARAVEDEPGPWGAWLAGLAAAARRHPRRLRLFPVLAGGRPLPDGSRLQALLGAAQSLPDAPTAVLCRDLAQAIAQWAGSEADPADGLDQTPRPPLKVFISHTKHDDGGEGRVARLIEQVRQRIDGSSRLASFFDSHALQAGEDWQDTLRRESTNQALLALRSDLYASREWCQREMVLAKRHGVPVVVLDAPVRGEPRGSFLMDHVARVPVRWRGAEQGGWDTDDIDAGLARLVDGCLQRALWQRQRRLARDEGLEIDWWAAQAPEPATLVDWLASGAGASARPADGGASRALTVLHPDPPLGPEERGVLDGIAALAGGLRLDILTPRLLAAREA